MNEKSCDDDNDNDGDDDDDDLFFQLHARTHARTPARSQDDVRTCNHEIFSRRIFSNVQKAYTLTADPRFMQPCSR